MPVPVPVAAPAPPAPDPMTVLRGKWIGEANGRRFELSLEGAAPSALKATAVFTGVDGGRSITLTGTYDPATRTVALRGAGAVTFDGRLNGSTLSGTYAKGEQRGLGWSVSKP